MRLPSFRRGSRTRALEPIRERVLAGERLSFADGAVLYRTPTCWPGDRWPNHVRERRHGDAAYFVWNTHINHTKRLRAPALLRLRGEEGRAARVHDGPGTTSSPP